LPIFIIFSLASILELGKIKRKKILLKAPHLLTTVQLEKYLPRGLKIFGTRAKCVVNQNTFYRIQHFFVYLQKFVEAKKVNR
jgi:hypothetical protein